jgi:hypothetical protein
MAHLRRRASQLERGYRQHDGPVAKRDPDRVEPIAPDLDDATIARRVETVRNAKRRLGRDLSESELDRLL